MKKNSGVYFGSDEKEIRIGCSIDVWDRTKNHQSSNNRYKVVGFIPTDKKEIFDEAKAAGFDVKTIKKIISIRKLEKSEVDDQQFLFESYCEAIQMDLFK